MVAAFTPQKRHILALETCEQIVKQRKNVVFVFLGDGTTRTAFLEAAAKRQIRENIVAPGYVRKVDDYYAIADICILTSRNEGFGYAVLEAMKHSIPVVVFDSGALPELVQNGATGFVVPDGDTDAMTRRLSELLDNESLRLALGAQALKVAQQNSREAWVERLSASLRDCVASGSAGG
jgi:glycosyltransferase involved in cell wall biosynthesis